MTHYHVGHNTPGYLPESDPVAADTLSEALSILDSDLTSLSDSYFESCEGEIVPNTEPGESEHCEWCDVSFQAQADHVAIHDGDTQFKMEQFGPNADLHLNYSPPEGPDLVFWVVPVDHSSEPCELETD